MRNRFIGRRRELELARRWLTDGAELLTLWGPGGAGKTRIAGVLTRDLKEAGVDAVFCDLGDAASMPEVETALLRALDLEVRGVPGAGFGASLAHAMNARSTRLLVIDNAEASLAAVAAIVSEVLASERGVQIVVTTRERLQLTGERSIRIGGLELEDAIDLFTERAREADAEFTVAESETKPLTEMLRTLELMPLAIELAASRLDLFQISELAARLTRDFALLASRKRDVPERHSSLEAAFTWSWNLLEPGEQQALVMLSVFAPSFRRDDASSLIGLEFVQRLLDVALLAPEGKQRLRMPRATRAFAQAHLGEVGTGDEEDRHAAYFAGLKSNDAVAANVDVAAAHYESVDPAAALPLLKALGELADRGGEIDVAASRWSRAAACAASIGDEAAVAQSSLALGSAHAAAGRWDAAHEALVPALLDSSGVALAARGVRARCLLERGDSSGAEADVKKILANRESERNAQEQGRALTVRAALNARRGALAAAADDAMHAADLLVRADSIGPAVEVLFLLGAVLSDLGRLEETEQALARARALAESLGNRRLIASARMYAANVAAEAGHAAAAVAALAPVGDAFARLGDARMEAVALVYLGLAQFDSGDEEAVATLERATIASDAADPRARSFARSCAAIVAAAHHDFDGAKTMLASLEASSPDPVAGSLATLAAIACTIESLRRAGGPAGAVADVERALNAPVFMAHSEPRRLRARLLASLAAVASENDVVDAMSPWSVARDGGWFQAPAGDRVELGAETAAGKILAALALAYLAKPDEGLPTTELMRVGWPTERLIESSGKNRVWVALARLRQLGLREILVKKASGYMLRAPAEISIR